MASKSRLESNNWLRRKAPKILGKVLSIGSGNDSDGEGGHYRQYFANCTSYTTSEVAPDSGCDLALDVKHMHSISDGSFDCIFCSGVLEHVDDFAQALREMHRILIDHGVLLIGVPFRQKTHFAPFDFWRFTEYGVNFALTENGFKIDELVSIDKNPDDFPAAFWVRAQKLPMNSQSVVKDRGRQYVERPMCQSLSGATYSTNSTINMVRCSPEIAMENNFDFRVHIVTADQGWILEKCAQEICNRLSNVTIGKTPDPSADINYYINYAGYRGKQPGLEIAFFTHIEERSAEATRQFFEVAKSVDAHVCMSSKYANALRSKGIDNVHVIVPGVDQKRYFPLVRIGVAGRTYRTGRKGEDLVKKVMDIPNVEWHFTGSGWPKASKQYASEQMPEFYNSMDYILIPSYYEGGPMPVLEALACGKEIIAPPIGFVPDYPHIEYATGDADDLRRVLNELVEKRRKLQASVTSHTWEAWADQHNCLFKQLIASKRKTSGLNRSDKLMKVLLALAFPEEPAEGGPEIRLPIKPATKLETSHLIYAPKEPRKLEIGSGMNPHPGYEHLDSRSDLPHVEHLHDINKMLPFVKGTFDEILSWSCLEHVSWRNIKSILMDWQRILKPGGKLEIWVPDFEYLCRTYLAGKIDEHMDSAYIQTAKELFGNYTPSVWAMVKMFGGQDYKDNFHCAAYDFQTLSQILKNAGFEKIERHPPFHGLHLIAYCPQTACNSEIRDAEPSARIEGRKNVGEQNGVKLQINPIFTSAARVA